MKRNDAEFRVHCVIADLLKLKGHPRLIFFHPKNGGAHSEREGARFRRMGVLPGVADFALTLPDGRSAYMEVKAGKGRLSFNQRIFQERCLELGVPYAVVRSSWEAEDVLQGWGALRGSERQARAA